MNLFINRNYIDEDFKQNNKYLSLGDNFIDIGANIGTWSIAASKVVGDKGKVLSFEPQPVTYKFLKCNVLENRCKNVEIHNICCPDKEDQLYFSSNFDTMNHITNESHNSITIPVKELDSFTSELSIIDLLRIDVEGFELKVL